MGEDEKKSFGEYVRKKRLEANMTQKDLAGILFVSESTVSKWERGLSYPDVSLIPAVCQALNISEHEFFMACDDDKAHLQAKAAACLRGIITGMRVCCAVGYVAALVACFICNLAIFHTLSWFWVVLPSVALAYCITNLPFRVTRHRTAVCLGAATVCLMLLLGACWWYAGGRWLGGAVAIVAMSLLLPWGVFALWHYYGKHMPELIMALLSVWTFALLWVIWLVERGDWLLRVAYPIAALSVALAWAAFAIVRWLPCDKWVKIPAIAFLVTFSQALTNSLCARLLPGLQGPALADYFTWWNLFPAQYPGNLSWVNGLIFAVMFLISTALLLLGLYKMFQSKRQNS